MKTFLHYLFGCRHDFGWPLTIGGRTYRVCSRCGVERDYNWRRMQFMKPFVKPHAWPAPPRKREAKSA
jgi:hypothetical protein